MLLCGGDKRLFGLIGSGILFLLLGGCLWGSGKQDSNDSKINWGIVIFTFGAVSAFLGGVFYFFRALKMLGNILKSKSKETSEYEMELNSVVSLKNNGPVSTNSTHSSIPNEQCSTKNSSQHENVNPLNISSGQTNIVSTEEDFRRTASFRVSVRKFHPSTSKDDVPHSVNASTILA